MVEGREPDLTELEMQVRDSLRRADEGPLRVLGYGEITLVLGVPADGPRWACKRLPDFPDAAAAATYRDRFERYLDLLSERGVTPVPSRFRVLDGVAAPLGGSRVVGYVVQPALDPGTLGPRVLAAAVPDPDHPVVTGIVDAVLSVCDDRTGLDGQLSNWAWDGSTLSYLDVTTPMLFDDIGRFELDMTLFLAAYPWALRAVIGRFVAPGVVGAYRGPRHVLVDVAANLVKERLDPWIPAVVTAANRALSGPGAPSVVEAPVTEAEVRSYYRSDARLWEAMFRLRRADRWWQRRVRRRDYQFLLPRSIDR